MPEYAEDDAPIDFDESTAMMDDRYWSRVIMLPFTWERFTRWWIARRWIIPRDPTRR